MTVRRILVVDDEEGILEVVADTLCALPDSEIVTEIESPRAAKRLATEQFDLLITDIRMPKMDGVELLRLARASDGELPVLMLTAFPTVETAVASMKLGAVDYLVKPFIPDDLLATVRRILDGTVLRRENKLLQRHLEREYVFEGSLGFDGILGRSKPMQEVFEIIDRCAKTTVDVLVVGETGTGKELVARSIHKRSDRKEERFVPVDCGAIPENLLESELFGHEKGAFTGAHARSLGLLEFADHGTFFLDEVAELPLQLQAKLLRVLQERKFRRVGGNEELSGDVRVIAATNCKLDKLISEGRFRQDLYYRLNVICIEVPPLRSRIGDIPLLVDQFFQKFAREMGKERVIVGKDVVEVLARYSWPGNVRQLQNVIKRTVALAPNETLSVDDLPDEIVLQAGVGPATAKGRFFESRSQQVEAFEKDYLFELLKSCNGDVTKAAKEAELPRGTLYRLMKKNSLSPEEFRS